MEEKTSVEKQVPALIKDEGGNLDDKNGLVSEEVGQQIEASEPPQKTVID